ncbi:MAG: cysteine desulfurase [Planctomycetes bacterium]|nr:cysteine desulfurase [Planctomycetota bacterium]
MTRLYLDHAASSPLRPVARDALLEAYTRSHANPSSAHGEGRAARRLLEEARERLAAALGCARDEILFTSGGTEANALALRATPPGSVIAAPAIEHPSLLRAAEAHGSWRRLPVDGDGRLHVGSDDLRGAALVSAALANHELGTLQDLPALVALSEPLGVPVHTDATQAFGRTPFEFARLGVRLLSVTAHKIGGPVGIGALVVARGTSIRPLWLGGGQEAGLRPGTEPAALAHAFAAVADEAVQQLAERTRRWTELRALLCERLLALDPTCVVHGSVHTIPNTLDVSFPGRPGDALVHRLDLEGVAVSHGAACSTGSLEPSPVLLALGLDEDLARSSLRVSFGPDDTREHVEEFTRRLEHALRDVRTRVAKKFSRDARVE